jgi:hypothetical protein
VGGIQLSVVFPFYSRTLMCDYLIAIIFLEEITGQDNFYEIILTGGAI